jgi:hypothetical protein
VATSSAGRERARTFALALVVAACTAALWWKTVAFGFTNLDDDHNLLANPHFRGWSREHLAWMASARWMGHWQPATWLSYALDFALGGLAPAPYHQTAVLLHALGAAALFALARALMADLTRTRGTALDLAAAVAALSWSLHPLRAEPVAWVTGRNDVLALPLIALAALAWYGRAAPRAARVPAAHAAAIVLAALGAAALALSALHLPGGEALRLEVSHPARLVAALALWVAALAAAARLGGGARYALALSAALLAGGAKEHAAVLPAVFALLDLLRTSGAPAHRRWRTSALELAPCAAGAAVLAVLALWARDVPGDVPPHWAERGAGEALAQAALAFAFVPWKTLLPRDLTPIHDLTGSIAWTHPEVLAALAAIAAAAWAAWALRRRAPAVGIALCAYAVLALPTLGLVRFGTAWVGERYAHASALPWHLLAGAAWLAWRRREAADAPWARAAALSALALLARGALLQAEAWRDSRSLWTAALEVEETPRALANLALAWTAEAEGSPPGDARRARAVELSARALQVAAAQGRERPEYERTHAIALQGTARYGPALESFARYLALRPDDHDVRLRVVLCLMGLGRRDEAREAALALRGETGDGALLARLDELLAVLR